MVLESRFAPSVSRRGTFVIVLVAVAVLVLPWFVPATLRNAQAASATEAQAAPAAPTTHEFPFVVRFEQGATRFLKDDKITILEVRGTAETFAPGNLYWIKGTYRLDSHGRATLAAFTTARDAKDGRDTSLKVQTTIVNQGDGTFALFLPMKYDGWPHVSFYPAGGGESFGGNYFGTGDSVLKRWWGSKESE